MAGDEPQRRRGSRPRAGSETVPDRRVVRLGEMTDAEIREVAAAGIPPELRYSLDDIPDTR